MADGGTRTAPPDERVAALNAEANALTVRAELAERRASLAMLALRRIADEPANRGRTPDFRRFAADAIAAIERETADA